MRKLGMIIAGAALSLVMAFTMMPAEAQAKVKVNPTTLEGVVYEKGGEITTTTDSFVITNTKLTKKKGVTNKVTLTVTSSNPKIVKVTKAGEITYLNEGTAKITVKEVIATTKKVKGKKKTTKTTSTAVVKVVVTKKVIEIDADGNVICRCGCAECASGECNIYDGCNCECDDCVYMDYEGGKLITDEDFDDDAFDDDDSDFDED